MRTDRDRENLMEIPNRRLKMKIMILIATVAAFMTTANATAPTAESCCGGGLCCSQGSACCAK
jgi:hypothetical protein